MLASFIKQFFSTYFFFFLVKYHATGIEYKIKNNKHDPYQVQSLNQVLTVHAYAHTRI